MLEDYLNHITLSRRWMWLLGKILWSVYSNSNISHLLFKIYVQSREARLNNALRAQTIYNISNIL